jgi:hypothetical protein
MINIMLSVNTSFKIYPALETKQNAQNGKTPVIRSPGKTSDLPEMVEKTTSDFSAIEQPHHDQYA